MRQKIIDSLVDKAERSEPGSVLKKSRLKSYISNRTDSLPDQKKEVAVESYKKGEISRRKFLKMLGLAGTGVIATTLGYGILPEQKARTITGKATENCSYDIVQIPSGGTEVLEAGSGETLENKLVDITADNAAFRVRTGNTNWTIRNIGVRGVYPLRSKSGWSNESPIIAGNDVEGGVSRIENCYFGDGGDWASNSHMGQAPLFMATESHSGEVHLKNINCQGWHNNAIYCNYPGEGAGGGSGGTVHLKDSFFKNNGVASIRLGSDGSTAENCVVVGGPHRGYWVYWENATLTNCDAYMPNGRCFEAGGKGYDYQSTAQIELKDCSAEGATKTRVKGGAEIIGQPKSNPRTTPPQGVPTTPKKAACGKDNSTSQNNSSVNTLSISGGSNSNRITYVFAATGKIEKTNGTQTSDAIFVTKASGFLKGETDSFKIHGEILDFSTTGNPEISYNGQQIDLWELKQMCQQNIA